MLIRSKYFATRDTTLTAGTRRIAGARRCDNAATAGRKKRWVGPDTSSILASDGVMLSLIPVLGQGIYLELLPSLYTPANAAIAECSARRRGLRSSDKSSSKSLLANGSFGSIAFGRE